MRLIGLEPGSRLPFDASAVPDRWIDARTLLSEDRPDAADPDLLFRVRLVEAEFKYPLLRLEEALRVDPATGSETLIAQVAMVADHVLLKPDPGASEQSLLANVTALGGTVRSRKPASGILLVTIPAPLELDGLPAALDQLKTLSGLVSIAEPDFVVHAFLTPNDPSFAQLYGLHNTGQTGGVPDADIDAPEAWGINIGSRDILVGVIDTGIDRTHPDLAANMWTNPGEIPGNGIDDDGNGYVDDVHGWDFVNNTNNPADDHYHGTHCAGTIGAVGGNGVGVVGVAHHVSLVALKFLSATGGGTTSDAVEAVAYATGLGVHLTSNSWGGGGYSQALHDVIQEAGEAGQLFIAAAGNNGSNTDFAVNYPSGYDLDNIVAVAATDHADALAGFSNYGAASVDLAAPGVNTYSTAPGNTYRSLSGTSMATPHVAGAAAVLLSEAPSLSAPALKTLLLSTTDAKPALAGKTVSGGRLNLHSALLGLENLLVSPSSGWNANGPVGGPFPATSVTYTLTNLASVPRAWSAESDVPWITLGATSGTVPAGGTATFTASLDTSAAQLLPPGNHNGLVRVTDLSNNREHLRTFALTVTPPAVYTFNLDTDPGWPRTGEWAYGQPAGLGGGAFGNPDPASGHTGSRVFGINLNGNYSTTPGNPHTLTAGPFNLAGYAATRLQFRRWLNSDYEGWVSSRLEISTDGGTWTRLWSNGNTLVTDRSWLLQDFDISAHADDQSTVYIRWVHHVVGFSQVWPLSGWNIDDIAILGAQPQSVIIDPLPPVTEGAGALTATLRVQPAPSEAFTVEFTSSDPALVPAPATLSLPAGTTTASVPLTVLDNTLLDGTRTVRITPVIAGHFATPLSLVVHDDETATLALELPASATEGDPAATATLRVSAPPAAPITVTLSANPADAAVPPATVIIPAGATEATFSLSFPDNLRIEGPRVATLTATVPGWTAGTAQITVADNDARTLSITLAPGLAEGGGLVAQGGTVSLAGTLASPLVVSLTSSDTTELSVPDTVTIPAGATSAKFDLTLPDDDLQDGVQTVTVTATADTFSAGSATAPVADNDPASFAFATVASPQYVGQAFAATLSALDIDGAPASGFVGTAALSGAIAGQPAAILPAQTAAFVNGVWTGAITCQAPGDDWTLRADFEDGVVGTSNPFTVRMPVVQTITLANNDIIYDPGTDKIYASTPSGTLVPIDPATGALGTPVPVATTATTHLARATDGSRLWVAHDNGLKITPVRLDDLTQEAVFASAKPVRDFFGLAGSPLSIIATDSDRYLNIYDSGVARPSASYVSTGSIEPGAASDRVFGYNSYNTGFDFYRLRVTPTGVSILDARSELITGFNVSIHSDGNLVAATSGRVVDGEQQRILASLPYSGPVRPDANAKRVYLLSDQGGGVRRLRAYDTARFSEVGAADVTGVSGTPSQLIRVGAGSLAFRTSTQVFLLNTVLVPSPDSANLQVTQLATPNPAIVGQPLNYLVSVRNLGGGPAQSVVLTDTFPTGATPVEIVSSQGSFTATSTQITATLGTLEPGAEATLHFTITPATPGTATNSAQVSSATGDPDTTNNLSTSDVTVTAATTLALRRVGLGARDLAYDPVTDRLLITTSNTASVFPNSLLRLAPQGFAAFSADYLGDNPGRIKLSANGQFAYTILDGSYGIARAPVTSGASQPLNFPVGHTGSTYGIMRAGDLAAVAGRPSVIAVANAEHPNRVALFENSELLPAFVSTSANVLADSADASRLYGYNSSSTGFNFYQFGITPSGVTQAASGGNLINSFAVKRLKRAGSLIYTTNGRVIDPETFTLVADLAISGPVEPSLDDDRIYILDGTTLRTFDLQTHAPVGTLPLGTLDGTPLNLVRSGGRSLAFVTSTGVLYLLDSPDLVPPPPLRVVLPSRLTEGAGTVPGIGRVEILRPAEADIPVTLDTSAANILDVTRSVVIPAGQTFVTFDVTVTDNDGLNGTRAVVVSAATPATYTPKSATVLVDDDEVGVLGLSLPANLTEGAGIVSGQATVTLSGPAIAPLTVALSSSDTTELQVPATVTIPAGAASVTFDLILPDDDLIDGTQTVTVSATVPGYTSASAQMQILDNESRVLSLSFPSHGVEGSYVYATLTLPGKLVAPLTITFASSDTTELSTPSSRTIAAGQSSASIYCSLPDDTLRDGTQNVTLTASAAGFTSGSATLAVRDNDPATGAWLPIEGSKTAGVAFAATLTLQTIDGYPVPTGISAAITALNSAGSATLSGAPVSRWVHNGSASMNLTVLTAGADTRLRATIAGIDPIESNPFEVSPGPLERFTFATIASPQTALAPFPVTISALDFAGNLATSFNGTASLSAGLSPRSIGAGTGTYIIPFYGSQSRTQTIYLASELGGAGRLAGLSLDLARAPGGTASNFTIRIKTTPHSAYSSPLWESTGWTTVYQGSPALISTGWQQFHFTTPFDYDGTSNLLIDFSYNGTTYLDGTTKGFTASGNRTLWHYTQGQADPLTWSGTIPTPGTTTGVLNLRLNLQHDHVAITPDTTGAFVDGVWTGNLTADRPGANVAIQASSGGALGSSNPFTILSGGPPTIIVTTGDFSSAGPRGGPFDPQSATWTITNQSTTPVTWSADHSAAWLSLSPASGTLASGANVEVTATFTADAQTLAPGTHTDEIVFFNQTNGLGSALRNATLAVLPVGDLALTPASGLAAEGERGGPFTPASASWTLSNPGDAPLAWSAAKTASWLTLDVTSGDLAPGDTATVTATINAGANALAAGAHADTVTFTNTSTGRGDTTRPIALTVRPGPPQIVTPPGATSVRFGEHATLQVVASVDGATSYQWYRGSPGNTSAPVAGATGAFLLTPALRADTAFWVRVSNATGSVDSSAATVTVLPEIESTLMGMGLNLGRLGDGTTTDRLLPARSVAGFSRARAFRQSAFLKPDATLWMTGPNDHGQLGDGTSTDRVSPVQIASGVAEVAVGHRHTLFVKTDGTLWGMGANAFGQLGNDNPADVLTPVQIASGVAAAAAGSNFSYFLKTDGTLWSMGYNDRGQLGDGTTTNRSAPLQVASGVALVRSAFAFAAFAKTDGTLWTVGYNGYGQLGDGTTTDRSTPVQVATGVAQASIGERHVLFLKPDGTLWSVGNNDYGQLGSPTSSRSTPAAVTTGIARVSAGDLHSLLIKTDNSLWASGYNVNGQLGDGTTTNRHTPVRIDGSVMDAAGGSRFSLFLSLKPGITAHPLSVSIVSGQTATLTVGVAGGGPFGYQWHEGASGDTSQPVTGATSATFTTPALSSHTRYWVLVSNAHGSIHSQAALVTVLPAAPVLAPEPAVTGGAGNTLAWAAVAGASDYELQAATTADFATPLSSGWISALTHTFPSLTDGQTWHFRVRARENLHAEAGWTQTSAADFASGTATSVDLASQPGDVVLAGGGLSVLETFESTTGFAATAFPDTSAGTFELSPLASGPSTTPPLPINQGGDREARLVGYGTHALMAATPANTFADGAIEAYLAPANRSQLHYGGLLLRASRSGSQLNGYAAIILFYSNGTAKADFSRIIDGNVNGTSNWFYTGTTTFSLADHENIRARFSIQGATLTLRLWRVAVSGGVVVETPIPFHQGTNTLTATDYTYTASGRAGIYAYTNPTTSSLFDDVTVTSGGGANYISSGSLVSPPITPNSLSRWGRLDYTASRPAGTILAVDVLDATGSITLASDIATGADLGALSALNGATSIRLRTRLATTQSASTPRLSDWSLAWQTTSFTPLTSPWSATVTSIQDATPPTITVTSPTTTSQSAYPLAGTASDANAVVRLVVNGQTALTTNGFVQWSRLLFLQPGENILTLIASDSASPANTRTQTFTVTLFQRLPDADDDGLPDAWEIAHDLDPASSSGDHGPLGDPDRDGIPNLLEYALGLDPRSPDPLPNTLDTVTHPDTGATHLAFSYRRLITPGAIAYTILTSNELGHWSAPAVAPELLSITPTGDGITETVTVRLNPAIGPTPLFVRLQVHKL